MGNTPPMTWSGDSMSGQYGKAQQTNNNEKPSPYKKAENETVIAPANCFTDTDSNVIIKKYKEKQYTDTEFYENLILVIY